MWGLIPLALNLLSKLGPLLAGPASQFVTGINFGQVLQVFWPIILDVLNNIKKYWRYYLPAVLVALQAITAFGWYHEHNALKIERTVHQLDVQTYKKARADAVAKAQAEKKQLNEQSKIKANEADQNYSALLAKYRANLLRYKDTQSSTGESSSGQSGNTSQGTNGPSASTDVPPTVTITTNDAQICAINTARLQAAHDWALHLGD